MSGEAVIHSLEVEMLAVSGLKVHTSELFNPYRFVPTAQSTFNLAPGPAYDLRTGEDLSDVWSPQDDVG